MALKLNALFLLLLFKLKLNFIACQDCDNLGVILYEDLSCEAVRKEGNLCPVAFNCDDLKPPNPTSCIFRKKIYNLGEAIPDEITTGYCEASCRCDSLGWNCGSFDCPEVLNDYYLDDDCFYQYELNDCCSTKTICPPATKSLVQCVVGNKTYFEGQKFFDGCWECVCKKGFKIEAPFCRRRMCIEQIYSHQPLGKYCAPVYKKDEKLCCPLAWVCAKGDEVITSSVATGQNSDLKCRFNNYTLNLGDNFKTQVKNPYGLNTYQLTCTCSLPPLVTCLAY